MYPQLVLKSCVIKISARGLSEWISCDIHNVDGLGHREVPHAAFIVDHVERHVNFLKVQEIVSLVEHFRVKLEELVARQIESFEILNTAQSFENDCWAPKSWH